jgi:hypothetical protein
MFDQSKTTAKPRSVSTPPHPADGLTLDVTVGENAHMTIPDPRADSGAEWIMRYGDQRSIADTRFTIASLLSSYSDLLDPTVPMHVAVRRLRSMRQDFKEAARDGR